jgi:hypothetical protein
MLLSSNHLLLAIYSSSPVVSGHVSIPGTKETAFLNRFEMGDLASLDASEEI